MISTIVIVSLSNIIIFLSFPPPTWAGFLFYIQMRHIQLNCFLRFAHDIRIRFFIFSRVYHGVSGIYQLLLAFLV